MSMSNVSEEEMEQARYPGAIEIVKEGVSIATSSPILFGLYLIPAITAFASSFLTNFVSPIVAALATVIAYSAMGHGIETERSRVLLVVFALIAYIITFVLIGIGGIFLVIPGLYIAFRLQLTTAAIMLEEQGPISGLRRSWEIAGGNVWTIFAVSLVFFAISAILFVASILVTGGIPSGPDAAVALQDQITYGSAVFSVLLGPIQVSTNVFMYEAFRKRS